MKEELTIKDLQKSAYKNAVEKGWHEETRRPGEMLALMHSELSEALEELRNGKAVNEIYYSSDLTGKSHNKPEGVPIELADCVIRIMDFCGANGIDLEYAVLLKMSFNATRPHRHGGKKL